MNSIALLLSLSLLATWFQNTTVRSEHNVLTGHWVLNRAKSKFQHPTLFQPSSRDFSVTGDEVSISSPLVDGAGKEVKERSTVIYKADGNEQRQDKLFIVTIARWLEPRVLEVVSKNPALGEVVNRVRFNVSADGQTMTVTYAMLPGHVVVYDRK